MNYNNQKLYIPTDKIFIPPKTTEGKKNCFFFYGENVNFSECYNFLNIRREQMRLVFVPTIVKPRSYLTPEYAKEIRDFKLLPVKGLVGDYSKLHGRNFFFEGTSYLNAINSRYKILRYNAGVGFKLYSSYLESLSGIDKDEFDTTLLYCINLDKSFQKKLMFKRIFPVFFMLFQYFTGKRKTLPFEKFVLFVYTSEGGRYIKLYDSKLKNNNIVRIKNILINIQSTDNPNIEKDNDNYDTSELAATESDLVSMKDEYVVKTAIHNYTSSDSDHINDTTVKDKDKLITRSLAYNLVGDIEKAKEIANKIDSQSIEKRKEIIQKMSSQLLPKERAKSTSRNMIVSSADVPRLVDYQDPGHILNKRKVDFKENLKSDILDAFKTLEEKDIPLKVKSLEIKEVHSGPSEIYKTIKDRYLIELEDNKGDIHNIHVDIPHLTENGDFLVNGQHKVLINQLVRFPIFFPKILTARFESSYSVMKIHSKTLQNAAYFIMFAGSYKFPLLMYMAYKYGLLEILKDFGVKYEIIE